MKSSQILNDLEAQQRLQIQKNLRLPPTKQKSFSKHTSRACLECRNRHSKCDGKMPICSYCARRQKVCIYVESNRGGSRKKGVSKKKELQATNNTIAGESVSPKPKFSLQLPCTEKRHVDCGGKCDNLEEVDTNKLPCLQQHQRQSLDKEIEIHTVRQRYSSVNLDDKGLDVLPAEMTTVSPKMPLVLDNANFVDLRYLKRERVVEEYYAHFHSCHPFFPQRSEVEYFLDCDDTASDAYLLIMSIVGSGYASHKYSDNINLISDHLLHCYNIIKNDKYDDLLSLQILILISLVSHISGLHELSKAVRNDCMRLVTKLEIHVLEDSKCMVNQEALHSKAAMTPNLSESSIASSSPPGTQLDSKSQLKITESSRCKKIPFHLLADNAKRCFWEFYFFDVIIGSADGISLSKLASTQCTTGYPKCPSPAVFDYKTRAEALELVNNAVRVNINMTVNKPFMGILTQLNASLEDMSMRFQDPKGFNAPYLINAKGFINEGVHQAMILYHYAFIHAHRPFSFLWKIDLPQIPKCCDEASLDKGVSSKNLVVPDKVEARKLIETRKTIIAADAVSTLLIDTGAVLIKKRTPLFACSLALASLVHLSAYVWVENLITKSAPGLVFNTGDFEQDSSFGFSNEDLAVYAQYIKLSLNVLQQLSQHWILSGKLAKHIKDTIKLVPSLHSTLKGKLAEKPDTFYSITEEHSTSIGVSPSDYGTTDTSQNNHIQANSLTPSLKSLLDSQSLLEMAETTDDSHYNMHIVNDGSISPVSDTGCNWIDKMIGEGTEEFSFDNFYRDLDKSAL